MPLNKQNINLNFQSGLDTKTDALQVAPGKLLGLQNVVFDRGGALLKRNGNAQLASLPNTSSTYLTTLNDNLTAVGTSISAFSAGSDTWVSKGSITPCTLSTLPLIRNSVNQTQVDAAVASNGLVCSVYSELNAGATTYKYAIADSNTGQNIVAPVAIPVSSGTVTGSPRVFLLGPYFIIAFTNVITATSHLQYIAISTTNPTSVTANTDIASAYVSATTLSWDGVVSGNNLYLAYNTTTGGQQVKLTYLSSTLNLAAPIAFVGSKATSMSMCADNTNPAAPVIYAAWYDSASTNAFVAVVDQNINLIMNPMEFLLGLSGVLNITCAAQGGACTVFYEVANNYSYDSGIPSHYVAAKTITPTGIFTNSVFLTGHNPITVSSSAGLQSGMFVVDNTTPGNMPQTNIVTLIGTTVGLGAATTGNSATSPGDSLAFAAISSQRIVLRGVGLASKAFIIGGNEYFLAAYQSPYQPTYLLVNGSASTSAAPAIVSKLAYGNGGGYLAVGLPGVTVANDTASIPYLFKDLIAAVNKDTNVAAGTQTAGIYSQTGINLATFAINGANIDSAEIASSLHIGGGILWQYDGYLPVEHSFLLWPDSVECSWSTTGGSMAAQPDGATNSSAYYYQITYEWSDNQGRIQRSAPSIPIAVTTTGSGSSGSITINVPTLRATMKTANPVKIVIYRWSVAQQIYYQVTSLTSAQLNDPSVDSITYVDTLADSSIIGNNIIYTQGGVVEDVAAPATNLMTLFDTRLWLVDAEDTNLLWYSKQVIESTPVEMSDLFTFYVAPSTGAQGSTGPITALSVMDDKLIIFKANACYYVNGTGPDNLGNNNQYSQPIFITSTVGCANQQSIVMTPQGLMFQSDKGIWLLSRDLQTTYVGAPVEQFNAGVVQSAVNVPKTNQIRFTLSTGITLMYDYYYDQWGTFVGVPAISSCIFQGKHTFVNSAGAVYQESPGLYLDGSNPVLMSFTSAWFNLAGLQGFERAYEFYLLGTYLSPHKLQVTVAYDYNPSPLQSNLIAPDNYAAPYGSDPLYGAGPAWGGASSLEQWRVFFRKQKTQAFQITVSEVFDPSFGAVSGGGLTLHGLNLTVGLKKGRPSLKASRQVG